MASRSLPYILLLLYLNRRIIVGGTTIVYFYSDAFCTTLYATVETDSQAGNGLCGLLTAKSAMSASWDNGCSVTAYAETGDDPYGCSNSPTLVPMSKCTSESIGSFSVDCPQINGTQSEYRTTLASSSVPPTSSAPTTVSTPTVPLFPSASSQQTSTTPEPSPTLASTTTSPAFEPTTSQLRDLRSSPSLASQPSSLLTSSTSSSTPISGSTSKTTSTSNSNSASASTSPSPSPSSPSTSSQGRPGSGNDGNLSGPSTIALAVVLPGLAVIVAIVFGIRKWNNDPHENIVSNKHWVFLAEMLGKHSTVLEKLEKGAPIEG